MARRVRLSSKAASAVDAIVTRLIDEAGQATALRFVDALDAGLRHLAVAPDSGSPRFGYEVGIPDLRAWRPRRQPYIVFYVVLDEQVDVWRLLRERRDIAATLLPDDRG